MVNDGKNAGYEGEAGVAKTVRAIRGAITVEANDAHNILQDTDILLKEIIKRNVLLWDDIISIFFSATRDLDAEFPAVAARRMGLTGVPMMCWNEMYVPGSLDKCIRIMIHVNTEKKHGEIRHVYLKGAKVLRPDLQD